MTAESIETIATQTEGKGKLRNDGFDCFGMDDGARFWFHWAEEFLSYVSLFIEKFYDW